MKFRGFIFNVSFLWVDGMALFPFILTKKSNPDRILVNHECIHLRQQIELGLLLFYLWYFLEYLIRLIQYRKHFLAYMHISFEMEAFQNETNLNYLKERKFWAFLRYISKPD
jgi:hypothetical protein